MPNLKKTIIMNTGTDVDQLTSSLKKYAIDCFGYVRIYKDNTHISLCNLTPWIEILYSDYFQNGVCQKSFDSYQAGNFLWVDAKDKTTILAMKARHNIEHGITIILGNDEYWELYNFASSDPRVNASYFINHLDLFYEFIHQFPAQAKYLLLDAEKDRNILPKCSDEDDVQEKKFPFHYLHQETIEPASIIDCHEIEKYFLEESPKNIVASTNKTLPSLLNPLSPREQQCLALLGKGQTAKSIGSILALSPKTVYHYVDNIKKKLSCSTKKELIELYWSL